MVFFLFQDSLSLPWLQYEILIGQCLLSPQQNDSEIEFKSKGSLFDERVDVLILTIIIGPMPMHVVFIDFPAGSLRETEIDGWVWKEGAVM